MTDLLIEFGTEEQPTDGLQALVGAIADSLDESFTAEGVNAEPARSFLEAVPADENDRAKKASHLALPGRVNDLFGSKVADLSQVREGGGTK